MTIITNLPFTLQNGTTADATQVMANFNEILNDVNNNAAHNDVNADITALTALVTPITPAQGGTTSFTQSSGPSTGTVNAQVVATPVPAGFALSFGDSITFSPGFTNTGSMTLNVNGTGVTACLKPSPSGPVALTGGEVRLAVPATFVFDGLEFILQTDATQYGGYGPLVSLVSATSTDLGSAAGHNVFITGTTTIAGFGSSASTVYPIYQIRFQQTLTLTNSATLALIGGADIVTAVLDTAVMFYDGAGAWIMLSYIRASGTAIINPTPMAGAQGLVVANESGTPNTKVLVTADQTVLVNPTGNVPIYNTAVSVTINCTVNGANGLDAGSLTTSSWYHIWLISNGSAVAGLASLSATAPTMPSGYTYRVRVGAMRTDGSSNFMRTRQVGNKAQYTITAGSNTTAMPTMTSGSAGLWTAVAVAVFVPPTATQIKGSLYNLTPGNNTGGGVAPNNGYVAVGNAPVNFINSTGTTFGSIMLPFEFVLESTNIYYTSTAGSASFLYALGWTDKVNAN